MLPIVRDAIVAREKHQRNIRLIHERMHIRTENPFDLPDERFIELFRLNKMYVLF